MGVGYYLAITTERPIDAIDTFIVAVVLVIIGTYCLLHRGQHRCPEGAQEKEKFLLQGRSFHSGVGHDLPDEAERGGACQYLHPEHHCAGAHLQHGEPLRGDGGHTGPAVPLRLLHHHGGRLRSGDHFVHRPDRGGGALCPPCGEGGRHVLQVRRHRRAPAERHSLYQQPDCGLHGGGYTGDVFYPSGGLPEGPGGPRLARTRSSSSSPTRAATAGTPSQSTEKS